VPIRNPAAIGYKTTLSDQQVASQPDAMAAPLITLDYTPAPRMLVRPSFVY